MNGYIKKQSLMDYCSNQITRTIDNNDIARFPIADVYTKADMIDMLVELRKEFANYEPKWVENEEQVVGSHRTWDDFDDIIQSKIDKLKENKDGV